MNGYGIWVRKELLEISRTWRRFVLPVLVLVMAVIGPILAKITPELVNSFASNDPGVIIQFPEPTATDAMLQWGQSLNQIVLFGIIIIAAGLVSSDLASGAGQLMLVKPLSREAYILAKVTVLALFLLVLTIIGAAITGVLTQIIFGALPFGSLVSITAIWLMLALVVISLMTVLSAYVHSQAAAAGIGIGLYFLTSVLVLWRPISEYTPAGLMTAYSSLAVGKSAPLLMPILISVIAVPMLLWIAIVLFRRQSIR